MADHHRTRNASDVLLRPPSSAASARICPECGGTVADLRLHPAPGNNADARMDPIGILAGDPIASHSTSPLGGARCDTEWFRGRVLAPWNDRIPSGEYRFGGVTHRLTINGSETDDAVHGFLYRLPMDVVHTNPGEPSALTLRRLITPSDEPGYPFSLVVELHYTLGPSTFTLYMEVENAGNTPAPVALGWHPYFRLPGAHRVDPLRLWLATNTTVPVDESLLPIGGHGKTTDPRTDFRVPHEIGTQELDLAFLASGGHTARLTDGRIVLEVRQSELFRYVQIFIPPDRRSIAIEPVTAATNSFNLPELGLQIVDPGARVAGTVTVSVSTADAGLPN